MSLRHYFDIRTVRQDTGAVVASVPVSFATTAGVPVAAFDAQLPGGSSLGSTVNSDANGRIRVWLNPGIYRISANILGVPVTIFENYQAITAGLANPSAVSVFSNGQVMIGRETVFEDYKFGVNGRSRLWGDAQFNGGSGITNDSAAAKLYTNEQGAVVRATTPSAISAQLNFINTAGSVAGAIDVTTNGGGTMVFKSAAYSTFLATMGVNSLTTAGNVLGINNINNASAPEINVMQNGVQRGKITWGSATTGAILDGALNPKFTYDASTVTLFGNCTTVGTHTATGGFIGSGAGLVNIPAANLTGTVSDASLPAAQAGKLFTSGVEIDSNQGPFPSFDESQLIVSNASSGNPAAITLWRKGLTAVQMLHSSDQLLELKNFNGLGADFAARSITATGGILGSSMGLGTSSMGSDLFRVNGTSQLFGALTVNAAISASGLIESTGNVRGNAVQSRNGFNGVSGANADWGNLIWTAASTWEFRAAGGSRQFGFDGTNITTGIPILSTAPITTSAPITCSAPITATGAGFFYDLKPVIGSRKTGWGAPTGTATRTTFATDSVTTAQLAERLKALIDDLSSHGLIGA
jgi:hypothetical protein